MDAEKPTLRLPAGATAVFTATNLSIGSGLLRITGHGPAPFRIGAVTPSPSGGEFGSAHSEEGVAS